MGGISRTRAGEFFPFYFDAPILAKEGRGKDRRVVLVLTCSEEDDASIK